MRQFALSQVAVYLGDLLVEKGVVLAGKIETYQLFDVVYRFLRRQLGHHLEAGDAPQTFDDLIQEMMEVGLLHFENAKMLVQLTGAYVFPALFQCLGYEEHAIHVVFPTKAELQRKVRTALRQSVVKLERFTRFGIEQVVEYQLGLGNQIIRAAFQVLPVVEFRFGKVNGESPVIGFAFLRIA
jgi:hypothetical protein